MLAWLFLLLLGAAAALPEAPRTISPSSENVGSVELYEHPNYEGFNMVMPIKAFDTCYNIDCFDNTASSAKWDLPPAGNFDHHGYLAIFTDKDCAGMMHLWNLEKYKNDSDLAAKTHMDNDVTSIMVVRATMTPTSYVKECSGGTTVSGPTPTYFW